ncbi:MAG: hypothetical protein MI861_28305, partial [Pirellulales bacterium]|nr:hypothetical protein [Pirellulales bacterium]
QRQVAIEAAKGLVSDAAPNSSPAKPFIEYNDMRLYSPDIGVGWGTAIIENTGRTSRSLNSFDLKVVYSDGVTRSVRMLRPFRLERSTRQQISFYVYDRYHAIPLYVRWDRKRELLPVNRQYVETKSYSTTRRFHRPYHQNDGDRIYPRPDPY